MPEPFDSTSGTHHCHPDGAAGSEESGRQPSGGVHPGGGTGHPGGGLNRYVGTAILTIQ